MKLPSFNARAGLLRAAKLLGCISLFGLSTAICGNAFAQVAPRSATLASPPQCQPVTVPVALAEGGSKAYSVSGKLCLPASGQANTVILAVHGATYDHNYWDWPYQSIIYSYRNFMTAAGYAVFVYDRIGAGLSSHPASADATIDSDGYVAHQLVQGLRQGQLNGYAFKHVVLAGHSLGSYTSWVEAGKYHDVDAVIVTGIAHKTSAAVGTLLSQDIYPAQQDPKFKNTSWAASDPGYLTTVPGTRSTAFYYPLTTDPAVVQLDETLKQTVTQAELGGIFVTGPGTPAYYSSLINVPILLVNGDKDIIFCASDAADCSSSLALQNNERPYYPASPSMTALVMPYSGHDINLEVTAPAWYTASLAWLLGTAKIAP
ncbi:alpha/beta hydrolase [Trinickia sp. LjRoot230]|uniref:alpha/beta hydrolase n=1 Tax=Trinickia sp. LjRoot230 TaxID=3342288 RepID=UPI003ED0D8EA